MVMGFVVFWPIGLAILFWILWTKRHGVPPVVAAWLGRFAGVAAPFAVAPFGAAARCEGNSAFEEWKRGELDRLEQSGASSPTRSRNSPPSSTS